MAVTPSAGSKQVASVHADIGANTSGFERGAASVKSGIGQLSLSIGTITSALAILKGAWDFSVEGAKLQRLASAGDEVARQFGGNMDLIIQKVKEASLGTVSEMDIIASSNRAMLLGLGADADKLANLMEVAALRGRAMGVDTTKAFNDIVTGVGRASPLILDNLGIVINAKETYEKYAESIGKSATELTKAEKTQAILNAVLDEGNKMLKEAGGLALDNAGKVERMNASWKDFTDNRKRENEDLSGSFADAAANAIDGWDQYFTFMDSRAQIVKRAQEMMAEAGDGSGQWAKYFEMARTEWAVQKAAIEDATTATEAHAEAAKIAEEAALQELEAVSKVNATIIDGAIEITNTQKNFEEEQRNIEQAIADTRAEGEKLYPWEAEKIQENKDKLAELGDQYVENQEKFRAAQEERAAMMAVEAIEMSDGIAGFSDAERERARVILETTDIATAAAFEEQQAIMAMSQAVADGTLPVEEWGSVFDTVMADGVVSVEEVQAAIDAVPKENAVNFTITTTGAPPNLEMSNAPAPVGTQRSSSGRRKNADGGLYTIPSGWGNEGLPIGNSDTASGGEGLKLIPKGKSGNEDVVQAIMTMADLVRIDYNELARIVASAAQQRSK